MGKEKVIEKTAELIANNTSSNTTDMIMKYLPIILSLVALVICYLLFKRMQSLNSQNSSLEHIEKQFTSFVKEQSEINTINSKRLNQVVTQINQLSYLIQNTNNTREPNTVTTQMSPEREVTQVQKAEQLQQVAQPQQRELMPTSVIQTSFPMNGQENSLPVPMNTSNKKELSNKIDATATVQVTSKDNNKSLNKKVIDVQTLKEEVLIEEASSDDEE